MGAFSIWHWIIVLIVVLILFGGKGKLSSIMGDFGKGLKNFKDQVKSNKENEEESKILTINDEDEFKKVLSRCRDKKGKKDRSKKLHGDEIPDCITEYVTTNYPSDEITHSRMLRTKDGDVFYVVKLKENGILKFDEDCEFLD